MCRVVVAAWLTGVPAGCAIKKFAYANAELRMLIAKRVPELPAAEVVIPFEVSPEHTARARKVVKLFRSPAMQAEVLAKALFDPDEFGLRYEDAVTTSALETLTSGRGNCLSIASVYIGLARAIGLKAYYLDFSHRIRETHNDQGVIVHTGHMTAVVDFGGERKALDLDRRFGFFPIYRFVDDIEAIAHFYNNRGYELVHQANAQGRPLDWAQVAHHFRLATKVEPKFFRAWNNLGVAYSRMGRPEEAAAAYRRAIELNADFSSPHTNLGILYLETGQTNQALHSLRIAVRLDPYSPHVRYQQALALLKSGDVEAAEKALEEIIEIKNDYHKAHRLLMQIRRKEGRHHNGADGASRTSNTD